MTSPARRLVLLWLVGAILFSLISLVSACGADESAGSADGQFGANNASHNHGSTDEPADAGVRDASGAARDGSSNAADAAESSGDESSGDAPVNLDDIDNTPLPADTSVGVPCTADEDCPSGHCESVGDGRLGACTVACEAAGACPSGWECESVDPADGAFCTCDSSEEICDGLDNDCDGLVDEGDASTRLCGGEGLCLSNACECPAGFQCGGGCRDLYRDPAHCGGCGNQCPVACSQAGCVEAVDISVGADHLCAVMSDGRVRCSGANDHGQLGDGTTTSSDTPVDALWIEDATGVAAADRFSCATTSAGEVYCWGYNGQGQVDEAPLTERHRPTRWAQLDSVIDLDLQHYTGCATTSEGFVRCWGLHGLSIPTLIEELSGVTQVAVGDLHRCAIVAGGQVACWGNNTYGQLGDGSTQNSEEIRFIPMFSRAVDIAAGEEHTCVLQESGDVRCFGNNADGQLGLDVLTEFLSPASVPDLPGATAVTAGAHHTCAITDADQKVYCWGKNPRGQLGDGTTKASTTPVEVRGLPAARRLEAGDHTTCALTVAGDVYCWGERFGVNPRPVGW